MKKLIGAVLAACVSVGAVLAHPPKTSSKGSSVADTLKQLEQDYGDAIKIADTDKLNQILDDDWTNLGQSGKVLTKESFLADLKSGTYKLESFEIGPMYVKVLGNVAVVQGSVSEKSTSDGKESSRKSVWMDVFVKHGDKWVVVRSQTATMK
ncbi:MAG TPA: nuclear transport factor 2 family protein [Candidatus Polarisedimenticolia bacterium]|nr:nuclear transport factor 2 family protein [Candidatus Polarisedimenticolia bacterium]